MHIAVRNSRRWFRFSLRTLFVVVTVLGCGLGWVVWEMRIVRARNAVRDRFELYGRATFFAWDEERVVTLKSAHVPATCGPSRYRWIFGDVPICEIAISDVLFTEENEAVLRSAFPEAAIWLEPDSSTCYGCAP